MIFYNFKFFRYLKNLTSLRECSGLYAYAEHTHQELVRKLSICLTRMLSMRVRN
jgi:hypothetical protein